MTELKLRKTLFADIDGVCHPESAPDLRHARRLWEWCARNEVALVVTSNWRCSCSPAELKTFLQGDSPLDVMFFDVTPEFPEGRGVREREIRAWLAKHPSVGVFAAIDDNPWLFEEGCPWLITTDGYTGLSDKDFNQLESIFNS